MGLWPVVICQDTEAKQERYPRHNLEKRTLCKKGLQITQADMKAIIVFGIC